MEEHSSDKDIESLRIPIECTCKICDALFDMNTHRTAMLSCGHTFGKKCALILKECPVCHIPCDASLAPPNYLLDEYLDLKNKSKVSTRVECEFEEVKHVEKCFQCDDKLAELFCLNCDCLYCKECDQMVHQIKVFANHSSRIEANSKPKLASDKCSTHTQERLNFFCLRCDTPFCVNCKGSMQENHRNHESMSLDSAAKFENESIYDQMESVLNAIELYYEQVDAGITTARKLLQSLCLELIRKKRVIDQADFELEIEKSMHSEFKKEICNEIEDLKKIEIYTPQHLLRAKDLKFDLLNRFKIFKGIVVKFETGINDCSANPPDFHIRTCYQFSRIDLVKSDSLFQDSLILTSENHKNQIEEWIKIGDKKIWKTSLLWRASRDGFSAAEFHSRCDQNSSTLTIIKSSDGYIFGGYLDQSFSSFSFQSNSFGYSTKLYKGKKLRDDKAWIFSLTNPYNHPAKFKCHYDSPAACSISEYGPAFGHDPFAILITFESNLEAQASFQSIESYETSALCGKYPNWNNFMCGSESCKVSEIEVYRISN